MTFREREGKACRDRLMDTPVLARIIPILLDRQPELAYSLMTCGNSTISGTVVSAVYRKTTVYVDTLTEKNGEGQNQDEVVSRNEGKLLSIERYPRLRAHVLSLHFRHLPFQRLSSAPVISLKQEEQSKHEMDRSIMWKRSAYLISLCPNLTDIVWETGLGLGSDMWKSISAIPSLKRLTLDVSPLHPAQDPSAVSTYPRLSPELQLLVPPGLHNLPLTPESSDGDGSELELVDCARPKVIGQGGWGLGIAWENLEHLQITQLSQSGAATLATHFDLLPTPPTLETLSVSTYFLGPALLSSIARLGEFGNLRQLELGTSGTKLTSEGLKVVIEGCIALESLTLKDVEGRLEKDTWSSITAWPVSLRQFRVEIAESGNHHSWALHHLESIHHVPIVQLHTFCIKRIVPPAALLPFPTSETSVPSVAPDHEVSLLPIELLAVLCKEGSRIHSLCLDWWEADERQLEAIARNMKGLRSLRIFIAISMHRFMAMGLPFSNAVGLEELNVSSSPSRNMPLSTVKTNNPSEHVDELPERLRQQVSQLDTTIPDIRDVRKFTKRLPRLSRLSWTGRGGKGEWHLHRIGSSTNITFTHSAVITRSIWEESQTPPPVFDFIDIPASPIRTILQPPLSPHITTRDFPPIAQGKASPVKDTHTPATTKSPAAIKSRRQSTPVAIKHGVGLGLGLECGRHPDALSPKSPEPDVRPNRRRSTTHNANIANSPVASTGSPRTKQRSTTVNGGISTVDWTGGQSSSTKTPSRGKTDRRSLNSVDKSPITHQPPGSAAAALAKLNGTKVSLGDSAQSKKPSKLHANVDKVKAVNRDGWITVGEKKKGK